MYIYRKLYSTPGIPHLHSPQIPTGYKRVQQQTVMAQRQTANCTVKSFSAFNNDVAVAALQAKSFSVTSRRQRVRQFERTRLRPAVPWDERTRQRHPQTLDDARTKRTRTRKSEQAAEYEVREVRETGEKRETRNTKRTLAPVAASRSFRKTVWKTVLFLTVFYLVFSRASSSFESSGTSSVKKPAKNSYKAREEPQQVHRVFST